MGEDKLNSYRGTFTEYVAKTINTDKLVYGGVCQLVKGEKECFVIIHPDNNGYVMITKVKPETIKPHKIINF